MSPDFRSEPKEAEPVPDHLLSHYSAGREGGELPSIPVTAPPGRTSTAGSTGVVAVIVVLALVGGWWWGSRTPVPEAPITPVTVSTPPTTTGSVTVHVAGWVAEPGIVILPAGSRIVDAVSAAGGVAPGGRLDEVNLAEEVIDGGRIEVPGPQTDADTPVPSTPGNGGDERVNLNTADGTDLEGLPGVGPVLAGKIIEHRESNGPFETVEQLLDVPGIGEATLEELRPLVVVP